MKDERRIYPVAKTHLRINVFIARFIRRFVLFGQYFCVNRYVWGVVFHYIFLAYQIKSIFMTLCKSGKI